MTITIHRGNQIGGCITQIESAKGSKIQIDFGHNLPEGDKPSFDKYDDPKELEQLLDGVSDIYYTHYHGDHIGFEADIKDLDIHQHMGLLSIQMERELKEHMRRADELKEKAERNIEALKHFLPYKAEVTEHVGDIEITPFYVSHSAIDAHMFLIHCDGKYVLHTGDFRNHGYMGQGMAKVLQKINFPEHSIDVLITEGTMLSRDNNKMRSEKVLIGDFADVFRQKKYCFVLSSSMDADRFTTLYLATQRINRKRPFVVDSYQQRLINLVKKALKGIYAKTATYDFYMKRKAANLRGLMMNKGFTMMVRNSSSMRRNIDELMSLIGKEHWNEVAFVYSQFKGYVTKNHKAYRQDVYDFIHAYPWQLEYIHTSGHASKEALEEVCKLANPRSAIIPIHKDSNSDFRTLNISQELKNRVYTESAEVEGIKIQINN